MKQKMDLEKARTIVKVLLALAAAFCVIALIVDSSGTTQFSMYCALGAIVCIVFTILTLFTSMRCPFCGRLMIRKCLTVKTCPHCHRDLTNGLRNKKSKRR